MAGGSSALVIGMPKNEVDIRLKVYDSDGTFSRRMMDLWQHAGPIILDAMREFIASAPRRMDANQPEPSPEQRKKLETEALEHASRKFSTAISPQWIDAICQRGLMTAQRGVPAAMFVNGAVKICQRVSTQIKDTLDLPEEDVWQMCNTVHQVSTYEIEILLWQIGEIRRQEAARDRTSRAENFHQLVSTSVEGALTNARMLAQETVQTIEGSQVMLGDVAQVASAAQQSANAMGDAAKVAASLSDEIDTVTARMASVLQIEERASADAESARAAADDLSLEIDAITSVLELIRDIAGQTNLLSLNATIEAARAGDSGRGFAVVAQEVKSLAGQTARATDQIAVRIAAIHKANVNSADKSEGGRATMLEARNALHEMMDTMRSQVDRVTSIAAAIDETATAALSMSDLASQVNDRTHNVTNNLSRLSEIFTQVASDLDRLKASTDEFINIIGA